MPAKKISIFCPGCGAERIAVASRALRRCRSCRLRHVHTRGRVAGSIRERFEEKYVPEPNSGCWLWLCHKDVNGYGVLTVRGKPRTRRAHRISYELHIGPVSPELLVCHRCDNPACVNPEHLYIGTQVDNMRDRTLRSRNASSKLSVEAVCQIRELAERGVRRVTIAERCSVSQSTIQRILSGESWGHAREVA
jgi:hypothetical protein